MPSSLIIVALVVAWLLVLVPIVARRRQEVARTADSTLAARVVRSGGVRSTAEEGLTMANAGETDTEPEKTDYDDGSDFDELDRFDEDELAEQDDYAEYEEYDGYEDTGPRPYRRGRGGFDPEAAAVTARAKYAMRQRIVVLMLMAALVSGLVAGLVSPMVWWLHGVIDVGLVGYLGYLRRQVRIEEEIRERRTARLGRPQTAPARPEHDAHGPELDETPAQSVAPRPESPTHRSITHPARPGTVVIDTDDEDPMFAELDEPGALPYRRAVGE